MYLYEIIAHQTKEGLTNPDFSHEIYIYFRELHIEQNDLLKIKVEK